LGRCRKCPAPRGAFGTAPICPWESARALLRNHGAPPPGTETLPAPTRRPSPSLCGTGQEELTGWFGSSGHPSTPTAPWYPRNSILRLVRLWHAAHKLCRPPVANAFQSPLCGVMWSATVAGSTRPCSEQNAHNGWNRSCKADLRFQMPSPYQRSGGIVCGFRRPGMPELTSDSRNAQQRSCVYRPMPVAIAGRWSSGTARARSPSNRDRVAHRLAFAPQAFRGRRRPYFREHRNIQDLLYCLDDGGHTLVNGLLTILRISLSSGNPTLPGRIR
jgi:hypothetical protein